MPQQNIYPINQEIDFLFVSYGGGHIRALLPVAEKLKSDGYRVFIFALTTALHEVIKTNIPFFSYKDLPHSKNGESLMYGKKLSAEIENNGVVDINETIAYLGINFIDLVIQYGKKEAKKLWDEKGRQNFYPINTMNDVLNQLQPRFLISTNSPRSEKAAIIAAKNAKITSICLCDLLIIPESKWIKDKNFADYLFVINDQVKNMLIKLGRPEKDIFVTGNPAFDSIYDPDNILKANQYKKSINLDSSKKIILYASSPEPKFHPFNGKVGDEELPDKIEKILRDYAKDNKDIVLILRRHPSQNQNVKICERVVKSDLDTSFNVIVHVPDLIIQAASTIGMQAYLANKLLINIDCSVFNEDTPYTKMGIGVGVNALEDLSKTIDKVLNSNSDVSVEAKSYTKALTNVIEKINEIIKSI